MYALFIHARVDLYVYVCVYLHVIRFSFAIGFLRFPPLSGK